MNMEIVNKIGLAIILVLGLWFALQSRALSRRTVEFYRSIPENAYRFGYLMLGVIFAVFSLLGILGAIRLS